jgi:hypothetical protein
MVEQQRHMANKDVKIRISQENPADMGRILASSFAGSAIEYYDFLLYPTAAAVVFPRVFFQI